jgi:RNA recognition motif-containing protein
MITYSRSRSRNLPSPAKSFISVTTSELRQHSGKLSVTSSQTFSGSYFVSPTRMFTLPLTNFFSPVRDKTGKFSGNGHIEFDTLEHARDALPRLHGRLARNGSRLLLSYSRPRRNVIKHDENLVSKIIITTSQLRHDDINKFI